ncbi:hypothetical protein [Actinokineospora sp. NPDC004072]
MESPTRPVKGVLDVLQQMSQDGWSFAYPQDETGQIIAGYAIRTWPDGWWDGLVLHSEHHAEAIRANPDNHITWHHDGPALTVTHAVHTLPPPTPNPAAPTTPHPQPHLPTTLLRWAR